MEDRGLRMVKTGGWRRDDARTRWRVACGTDRMPICGSIAAALCGERPRTWTSMGRWCFIVAGLMLQPAKSIASWRRERVLAANTFALFLKKKVLRCLCGKGEAVQTSGSSTTPRFSIRKKPPPVKLMLSLQINWRHSFDTGPMKSGFRRIRCAIIMPVV